MPETLTPDPIAAAARAAVEQRGISARKLAKRLGMKPRTVLDFLNERRETRDSTRISICRELGIDHEQEVTPA
ncbi:helix-turn-helix domain-containing protein [Deinococcus enclensis]|uniref:Transcriptional regulator with XRE-family HTH domain n=1 Tax=Deinococcus enclensis TaxID=1049582 RepID=A0ABT9MBB3_9DEIO|nr:helix-turn-helix transcriptional regulator [Deinococcus enclensis]MDP9763879.1 transcriptional regulator with XRE-family HTH domain [Deinococcus enclensis]